MVVEQNRLSSFMMENSENAVGMLTSGLCQDCCLKASDINFCAGDAEVTGGLPH